LLTYLSFCFEIDFLHFLRKIKFFILKIYFNLK
jgi:hypothetical protein